jgi:hypothetical protein
MIDENGSPCRGKMTCTPVSAALPDRQAVLLQVGGSSDRLHLESV